MTKHPSPLTKIRNLFLTGLAVILPAIITIWALIWLFKLVDGILGSIIYPIIGQQIWGLGFVSTFLLIIGMGAIAEHIDGKKMLIKIESIIDKIPIARNIYNPTKQVVEAFGGKKTSFQKVVMGEYPRKGMWAIGFVTNDDVAHKIKVEGKDLEAHWMCVFFPTTPNPTSGYFVLVPRNDIKTLDMTVEQGLRMIVSGGVIGPQ